jgi:hypothetical protein
LISSKTEYSRAREELAYLTDWLSRLEDEKTTPRKGITAASVSKMIARLQEQLAEYEAAIACSSPASEERNESNPGRVEGNERS